MRSQAEAHHRKAGIQEKRLHNVLAVVQCLFLCLLSTAEHSLARTMTHLPGAQQPQGT